MGAFVLDNLKPGVVNNFEGSKRVGGPNPEGITSSITGEARKPVAPVVTGGTEDAVMKTAGPALASSLLETVRTGGDNRQQRVDRRGNPIGRERATSVRGVRMSAADWYRPGGPGDRIQSDMIGKTPEEQAAIARAAGAKEDIRKAQGVAPSDFYRDQTPLSERVKATGIAGLKSEPERIAAVAKNWKEKGAAIPSGQTPETALAQGTVTRSPVAPIVLNQSATPQAGMTTGGGDPQGQTNAPKVSTPPARPLDILDSRRKLIA